MAILKFPALSTRHLAEISYDQAKEHYSDVVQNLDFTNPEYQKKFREAQSRRKMAREFWLRAL